MKARAAHETVRALAAVRADAMEQQCAEPAHPPELPADHIWDGPGARLRGRAHSQPDAPVHLLVRPQTVHACSITILSALLMNMW